MMMNIFRNTIYTLIFGLAMIVAGHVQAATEFISIVDPDDAFGTDYTTLSAWEAAIQADLSTTTATMVFSYASATASGTIPDGTTVVGQTSGAVASSTHMTGTSSPASAQIMLTNITGTFQQNEAVYIQGQSASSTYVYLSDSGDSVIAVAQCRSTGGSADTTAVTVTGWTTSADNYIKIWTDPTDVYGRHSGVWSEEKYRLEASGDVLYSSEENVRIDGLQVYKNNDVYDTGIVQERDVSGTVDFRLSNSIIKGTGATYTNNWQYGFATYGITGGGNVRIWNNIFYDIKGQWTTTAAIICNDVDLDHYLYNNTIYNTYTAIRSINGGVYANNNIAQNSTTAYSGTFNNGSSDNISNDWTAPGSNSLTTTTVSFVNTAGNDFHLSVDDTVARDAGTTTIYKYDVDGTARGGVWDIGADEVPVDFTSIICEDTSAGGGCTNLDYNTLSDWEDAVEVDLTASTTRVFSGTLTYGSFDENDQVYYCDGSNNYLNVYGYVVATTSDQILIDAIVGTSTPLIADSSYKWYSTSNCNPAIDYHWTISGTGDELGASARAVGEIDGAWASAESITGAMTIAGWDTDIDNSIKVYTTDLARHNGKWHDSAYRVERETCAGNYCTAFAIGEANTVVDGIQILYNDGGYSVVMNSLNIDTGEEDNNIIISNNILKSFRDTGGNGRGISAYGSAQNTQEAKVFNNIIYNFEGQGIYITSQDGFIIYNNTVFNNGNGIYAGSDDLLKNNVAMDNGTDYWGAEYISTLSTHNVSSDGTADDDNFQNGLVNYVSSNHFVNIASGTEDFHLLEASSLANAGIDLSSTSTLSFLTDIDGGTRDVDGLGWDIGADEVATKIYRSVGNDSSDLSNSATVTISGTTATFSAVQPDNVGVGDVVQFGGSGFYDLAFVTARASSTEYSVQAWDGGAPTATTTASMNIYRAHLELNDWEDQLVAQVNTSIDDSIDDTVLVGMDLVASNTVMMVACYASTDGDDAAVNVDGWTTGASNYIKVYTPVASSEVGVSQRHSGKWDDDKYNLEVNTTPIFYNFEDYTVFEGIQAKTTRSGSASGWSTINNYNAILYVDSCIVTWSNATGNSVYGLYFAGSASEPSRAYNNIIYSSSGVGNGTGIFRYTDNSELIAYNNTVSNCNGGIRIHSGTIIAKNNITQGCTDGYAGTFDGNSDYNISDIASDAPNATFSTAAINVSFVDKINNDFHLSSTDTSAVDQGTSSPATDSTLSFTDDIDGNYRRQWDIGADEASINFDSTVMEDGGEFSSLSAWETANQVDLVATTTAVFSISANNGWIPVGSSLTGSSSGATASTTVVATSSNKILLYNITGTFVSGETVSMDSAVGNYVVLSNGGNPANAVAKIDGAWSGADTSNIVVGGWTTGVNNYVKIYTTDSARHNGKWDDNRYRLVVDREWGDVLTIYESTVIEGLQIKNSATANQPAIIIIGNGDFAVVKNNLITCDSNFFSGYQVGVEVGHPKEDSKIYIYNNIIYDTYNGIEITPWSGNPIANYYIYNNTIVNSKNDGMEMAFDTSRANNNELIIKNNIVQGSANVAYYFYGTGYLENYETGKNIAEDTTSPNNAFDSTTVNFVDSTNKDFHLSTSDTSARNAGTTTTGDINYYYDIDGTARGSAFDIGADELPTTYTSVICENTSAGGNCSDMDYSTLSDWEDAVETNLASSSTRVFGGTGTGLLSENDVVYLLDSTGTSTAKGYVVATTSDQILIDGIVGSTTLPVTASTSYKWQKDASNYWSVSGTDDDFGASAQVTAEIDGVWSGADATAVDIDGWSSDNDNYIKVYTTNTARHNGLWSNSKYRVETTNNHTINVLENYVRINGLQLKLTQTAAGHITVYISNQEINNDIRISGNIVQNVVSGTAAPTGIALYDADIIGRVYNNIIYGAVSFSQSYGRGIRVNAGVEAYIYNNTIYDTYDGIWNASTETIAINNLVSSSTDPYNGTFAAGTDYNATDGTDDIGTGDNNITNANFTFISTTTGSIDLHLDPDDTGAKDQGTNLRSDANINVIDDIDGSARANGFDIGADETAVKIYRSVGPSNTSTLSTGSSTTLTIDNLNATFSTAQTDNIGVGDAIQYDSDANGTIDSIAFIFSRTDSTHYIVTSASGTAPTAVAGDNDWQVYRAYTSLALAEAGTENTGINSTVRNFDGWTDGHDLVTANVIWNIACYGDAIDTTAVTIDGWTTGSGNYLKIFTPVSSSEVGVTQRHSGKWNDEKYNLQYTTTATFQVLLLIQDNFVRLDGIQAKLIYSHDNTETYFMAGQDLDSDVRISNSIARGQTSAGAVKGTGFKINGADTTLMISNCIAYDYIDASRSEGVGFTTASASNQKKSYLINSTSYNNYIGYRDAIFKGLIVQNSIAQENVDNFYGTFDTDSDYNISDQGDVPGTNSKTNTTVKFVDATNKDFHLHPSDTSAIDAGTSSVSSLFTDDIDGNTRRTWDIGADEASVYFDSSIMESGGEFSSLSAWESANQVDLTADDTAVFAIASSTGWIPVGSNVTGATSGATASTTVVATSSNKILLYNISGTFVNGENVELDGATTNAVELADGGNPAIAVAKIDGAWVSTDENVVTIDGWTTGKYNYVKIYTTQAARHQGKWDSTKYILYHTSALGGVLHVQEDYTQIDGLQIFSDYSGLTGNRYGISIGYGTSMGFAAASNCIIKGQSGNPSPGFYSTNQGNKVYDNIVYDFNGACIVNYNGDSLAVGETNYTYNNTVYNCKYGIYGNASYKRLPVVKNNIVQNCTIDFGYSTDTYNFFHDSSSNNISSDATAPGSNSKTNTTVTFQDKNNNDFHLDIIDTAARNAGVDLSSDATSSFVTDIDGTQRGGVWDIGADEASTEFVSSVMESGGDYSSLSVWEDAVEVNLVASGTLVYSGTLTGTFSEGDSLTLLRSGATSTVTGTVVATSSTQLLVKNIVDSRGEKYSLTTATGDIWRKDISNYWTVAGTGDALGAPVIAVAEIDGAWNATDTAQFVVDGWTTGPGNYIRVYTTDSARHLGQWSYNRYRINNSATVISISESYTMLDGLLVDLNSGTNWTNGITLSPSTEYTKTFNNIIKLTGSGDNQSAIYANGDNIYTKIYNNIVYGLSDLNSAGIALNTATDNTIFVYNNTVVNASTCYGGNYMDVIYKNNIAQNCTTDFSGTAADGSDFNVSSGTLAPGNSSQNGVNVTFVSTSTEDFHISPDDSVANNKGVNLTHDPYLAFTTDIEGDARETIWDIGADQNNSVNSSGESANPQLGVPPVDLTEGLVGYWNFNEGFGSTVVDKSGNGNDGTWSGTGVRWTALGQYGNGGVFNATDDVINCGSNSSLDDIEDQGGGGMTISAWIKPIGAGENGGNMIINKPDLTDGSGRWYLHEVDNDLFFVKNYNTVNLYVGVQDVINYGKWHHVVLAWDGGDESSGIKVFVNGVMRSHLSENDGTGGKLSDAAHDLYIGNRIWSSGTFNGSIDEVRLYNRNLSQTEVASLYNKGLSNTEWHFRNDYKDRGSACEQGNCKDLSSGGTGNQFTTGYLERSTTALSLNGSGYATLADDSYFDIASSADFSLIATLKSADTGSTTIISKRSNSDASSAGYLLGLDYGNGDGIPYFEISDGTNEFSMIASESISDNEWHTVVVVIDEDLQAGNKIYIDGVDKTSTKTGTITSVYDTANSIALNIGRNGDDTGYLTGSIDRIALLHYALTRDEILRESAGGKTVEVGTPERSATGGTDWDPFGGSAPVAWWKFDEMSGSTAKDYASSSLDGAWNGTGNHQVKGKNRMGGNFNGVDDYVEISTTTIDSNHTISMWLYGRSYQSGSYSTFIGNIFNGDSFISVYNGSEIRLQDNSDVNVAWATTIPTNEWFYLSIVRNGANWEAYKNGASLGTVAVNDDFIINSIGSGYLIAYPDYYWDGQIDDVKIYDYARTQAQIAWDYNKGAPIAHWKFDEAASGSADGATLRDSSGNSYNGTGVDGGNNTGLEWTTGKVVRGIDFDGVDDYVDMGVDLTSASEGAISVWVYINKFDYSSDEVFDVIVAADNDDGTNDIIGIQTRELSGTIRARLAVKTDNILRHVGYGNTSLSDGWHHLTLLSSGSSVSLFVDGIPQSITWTNSTTDGGYWWNDKSEVLRWVIGSTSYNAWGGSNYNGTIDDVRIYNYALTAKQVKEVCGGGNLRFGPEQNP